MKEREKEGRKWREEEIANGREVWVAVGDDVGKVPTDFTGEGGRGRWWVQEKKKEEQKG